LLIYKHQSKISNVAFAKNPLNQKTFWSFIKNNYISDKISCRIDIKNRDKFALLSFVIFLNVLRYQTKFSDYKYIKTVMMEIMKADMTFGKHKLKIEIKGL
jgi:hypothetical protein